MASSFPRPQWNVGPVNNALGAMRGDSMSMLRLIAQKSPRAANLLTQLEGMSSEQLEQQAQQMMQTNPQFAELVRNVQSKGFVQAARDYGINI